MPITVMMSLGGRLAGARRAGDRRATPPEEACRPREMVPRLPVVDRPAMAVTVVGRPGEVV
jgi:hypothetical protein